MGLLIQTIKALTLTNHVLHLQFELFRERIIVQEKWLSEIVFLKGNCGNYMYILLTSAGGSIQIL